MEVLHAGLFIMSVYSGDLTVSVSATYNTSIHSIIYTSIIGLVVEFIVAIDEARVRFTDDALFFFLFPFFFFLRFSFPAMSIRSFYYLFLLSRISSPLSAVNPPPIIASPQTAALQLSGLPIATHRCSSPTPRLIFSRSLDLPICLLCVFWMAVWFNGYPQLIK
jgi:hypothetical protein